MASERIRALVEFREEVLLLTMELSGLVTVKEELDLAWGLSLAASPHTNGLCGTPRSFIFNEIVTGVLIGYLCCYCCICFEVLFVKVLYNRSPLISTVDSFDSAIAST